MLSRRNLGWSWDCGVLSLSRIKRTTVTVLPGSFYTRDEIFLSHSKGRRPWRVSDQSGSGIFSSTVSPFIE